MDRMNSSFNNTVNSAIASAAAQNVLDRMKSSGWYGVASSPPDNLNEQDENVNDSQAPATARAPHTGGEGWRLWQTVNDSVKGFSEAVKRKAAGDDRLCESDEEDYAGPGDTHLTRIMKEYYIDRSSSPADLPAWLFPDQQPSRARAWESGSSSTSSRPSMPYERTLSSGRPSSRSRSHQSNYSSSSAEHDPYGDMAPPVPSYSREPSRPSSGASPSYPMQSASARRLAPSDHGSRTSQKLRQMKSARTLSNV